MNVKRMRDEMDRNYRLEPAGEGQVSSFIAVIKERIAWMEQMGMHQWNDEEYLDFYSEEYFAEHARNGRLFFLMRGADIAGAAALLESDERWDGDRAYLYVHHLATRTGLAGKGAGQAFLKAIEEYARKQGKRGVRLDCQAENQALNRFYEKSGYRSVGEAFTAGDYVGIRKVLEFAEENGKKEVGGGIKRQNEKTGNEKNEREGWKEKPGRKDRKKTAEEYYGL